jgi:hypothetical protein
MSWRKYYPPHSFLPFIANLGDKYGADTGRESSEARIQPKEKTMAIDSRLIINQIEALITKYDDLSSRSAYPDFSDLPPAEYAEFIALVGATIQRLSPPNSKYIENMDNISKQFGSVHPGQITPLIGILRALKYDYSSGNLHSMAELIHAETFSSFLEMAAHLLDQGYKDSSAVIAGSVLEEHLRNLALKNGLSLMDNEKPKKTDAVNKELADGNVYSKLDLKNVTAWLDLRDKAAQGKNKKYSKDEVKLLIQSVRDFITRNPA